MLNLTPSAEFMMIALHFMTCAALLCGLLVWTQRQENPRQRTILTATLLICSVSILIRVLLVYKVGIPASYPVFPIDELYAGFWEVLLLFLYPLDVVNPGWLRRRGLLVLFLPIIVITIILVFIPMEFRVLHSFDDMLQYITEPNVWFRLLILFIFIIPYTILLLCVPYNWRRSSVDAKWIRIYAIGMQGIGFLYFCFMLTGSVTLRGIHMLYCALFFMYVTYQELYLRLFPSTTTITTTTTTTPLPEPIIVQTEEPLPLSLSPSLSLSLWETFEHYMKTEKPWLSPNITLSDVAQAIGCNRSTLSAAISAQVGTDSFHSLVARYRIDIFCKMAKKGEIDNVNEALFAVGFRSRSTAYKRFKEQMGVTPAEYIKQRIKGSL